MIRAVSAVAGGFSNAHELAAAMRLHALLNGDHGSAECAPTARQLALQLPTQALGKTPEGRRDINWYIRFSSARPVSGRRRHGSRHDRLSPADHPEQGEIPVWPKMLGEERQVVNRIDGDNPAERQISADRVYSRRVGEAAGETAEPPPVDARPTLPVAVSGSLELARRSAARGWGQLARACQDAMPAQYAGA